MDFNFSVELRYAASGGLSIAFIKKDGALSCERPIATQLLMVNFPEGSPFDTLHAYIHNAVAPFLTSVATQSEVSSSVSSFAFPAHLNTTTPSCSQATAQKEKDKLGPVKRQLADLELALLNLKRDAEIPEIRFPVDARIEARLSEVCLYRQSMALRVPGRPVQ